MIPRAASAAALACYSALVVSAALLAADHTHELLPGAGILRAALGLALAFAIARPDGRFDRWVVAYVVYFGVIGLVTVGGQLWQRYVPDSAGMYILIDPVFFAVTLGSEALLAVAAAALFAAKR